MSFKYMRDCIITGTALNVYLHLNFPGYIEWMANIRNGIFNFALESIRYVIENPDFILLSSAVIACYIAIHIISDKLVNNK